MIFTNSDLLNHPHFDPDDPMTWTVSDWEACWALRTTDDNSVIGGVSEANKEIC